MSRFPCRLRSILCVVGLGAAMLAPVETRAASPDAWDEFRSAVAQACRDEASASYEVVDVLTDPFGSQDYGLSLLHVRERGGTSTNAVICVFSKETNSVQLGTTLEVPTEGTGNSPASVPEQTLR